MRCCRRRSFRCLLKCVFLQLVATILMLLLLIVASRPDYLLLPSTQLTAQRLHFFPWINWSSGFQRFIESRREGLTSLPDIILEPTSQCRGQTFLVALVLSPLRDRQTRDLIRQTWGRAVKEGRWPGGDEMKVAVEVFFVLGMPRVTNISTKTAASAAAQKETVHDVNPPRHHRRWYLPDNHRPSSDENDTQTASPAFSPSELEQIIRQEAQQYDDLIVGDFVDAYYNLTRKTLTGLQWAVRKCRSANFIVKVDQDTLVDFPRITDFLLQHSDFKGPYKEVKTPSDVKHLSDVKEHSDATDTSDVKEQGKPAPSAQSRQVASTPGDYLSNQRQQRHDVAGDLFEDLPLQVDLNGDSPVIRNAVIGNLVFNSVGNVIEDVSQHSTLVYPTYAAGPCYVLTTEAAARIVRAATYYPLLPAEDVHVTGVLAEAAKVERLHLQQFKFQKSQNAHPCHLVGTTGRPSGGAKSEATDTDRGKEEGEEEEGGGDQRRKSENAGGRLVKEDVKGSVHPRDSYYMDMTSLSRGELREAWEVMTSGVCFQSK